MNRSRVLLASLALAIGLSSIFISTAMADEGTPPIPIPTETPIVEVTSTGEVVATDESKVVVPLLADAPETSDDQPSDSAALDMLPDDSILYQGSIEIAVIDEDGELLPLVADETAEVISNGDPIWCPASVSVPKPNLNGCTASFNSLNDLFADLEVHPKSVDGVIWIEKDYNSTVDATLNGSLPAFGIMRNFRITLKGGWNGCGATPPATCTYTIDSTNPSEINHQIEILSWNNDITISDIVITQATTLGETLVVDTSGKVTLVRVEVSNNDGAGARIDNSEGVKDIIITASSFSDNAGNDGLNVSSKGTITLTDISANTNGGDGAYIDNSTGVTLKAVTLLGVNIFSENLGSGLVITSSGAISASNLVNNANAADGATFDNTSSTISSAVTLSGSSEFKYNGSGLAVLSKGLVTLSNITAVNNFDGNGVSINNASSTISSNVTINGINYFNENGLNGLRVLSAGAITLSKVTANLNGQSGVAGYGIWLDNTAATTVKSVAMLVSNTFNQNFEGGLFIHSEGGVTAPGMIANGNGGSGVEIDNLGAVLIPQNVTISGSIIASLNGGSGLIIKSLGAVSILNVTANDNSGFGGSLTNNGGTLARPITISGSNSFSGNDTNGLEVQSKGVITLNNVIAKNNLGFGGNLDNSGLTAIGGIYLNGSSEFSGNTDTGIIVKSRGVIQIANIKANSNSGSGVTLDNAEPGSLAYINLGTNLANWCNEFSKNANTGIEIGSNGTVTLSNVCANENGSIVFPGYGALVDNTSATNWASVKLNGINTFNANYLGGIQISSDGSITINNITASNNEHGFGAIFVNTTSGVGSLQPITVAGSSNFSGNYGNGLSIYSYGTISGSNLNANGNGSNGGSGYGALIDNCNSGVSNCSAVSVVGVTLSGKNTFNSNSLVGITVKSLGTITLNNIETRANDEDGALIDNSFLGARGNVTISTRGIFSENGGNGLEVTSRGVIGITNLEASENDGFGTNLTNISAPSPLVVTLAGSAIFIDNDSYGLSITSLGNVTVYNLQAMNNNSFGALLDNAEPGATGTITLYGFQITQENGGSGLEIHSNRVITVNSLTSNLNQGFGALIENNASGLQFDVRLYGINKLNENDLSGLEILTLGNVSINSINSTLNGQGSIVEDGYGVFIDNQTGAPLPKTVSFTGVNSFNENFDDGLYVISLGAITGNSFTAYSNGGDGTVLDNEGGSTSAKITLTGVNSFEMNEGFGLVTKSGGLISLTSVTANSNIPGGVMIDNSQANSPVDVTLSGINVFNGNGTLFNSGSGLLVDTQGRITISNVTASSNGAHGIWLNNRDHLLVPGSPTVTLTGVNSFLANGGMGLYVLAAGDVNVSKFVADGNVGDGLNIASLKNVMLSCGSATSNQGIGLAVYAFSGKLTLKGVFAYGNDYANMTLFALQKIVVRGC